MAFEIIVEEAVNYSIITLRNTESKYEAEIYSFGALLNGLRFPFESSVINVVEAFSSPAEAKQSLTPFFRSAKLSPFVCRMASGNYHFHGKDFHIEKYYMKQHAIHGLLYDAIFEIKESRTDQESAAVVLHNHYDGSDSGYPFEYDVEVEWKLSKGNMLSCTTTVSHTNAFAVPYADGWHPYFSLDVNIDECYLQFDSEIMVEFDEGLIPTGKMVTDKRFSAEALISDIFLDNCWLLDQSKSLPRVVLSSDKLRFTILPEASTHTCRYTPDDRRSIALESLSSAPDSFNNKMGLVMIQPNEKVSFTTHYNAEVINP